MTHNTQWTRKLKQREQLFEQYGIRIPIIPKDGDTALTIYSLSQSPYRQQRATLTVTLQRRRECQSKIDANPDHYRNYHEFLADCAKRPEDLIVHVKFIKDAPANFDAAGYGASWPRNGVLVTWIRLPSSNLSTSLSANDRQVCLIWSSEPHDFLHLENELRYLYGWNCYSYSKSHAHKDVCARICGTGGFSPNLFLEYT